MLTVTDAALQALEALLLERKINGLVRITLMNGCCKGDSLRLTLCERRRNDLTFSFGSLVFGLDRDLAAACGPVTVDFAELHERCPCSGSNGGFSISSERLRQPCGLAGCREECRLHPEEQEMPLSMS
jgi:Fe-S cluster assembly iron-binding protein IscA